MLKWRRIKQFGQIREDKDMLVFCSILSIERERERELTRMLRCHSMVHWNHLGRHTHSVYVFEGGIRCRTVK